MTQNNQHQTHLDSAIEQQQQILNEIQELNNQVATKKEVVLKVQGVIEYLQQIIAVEPEPTVEVVTPEETKKTK
tara:strand:- start:62 stop:283 length:222 start_codon:yes stop_codon:yes gene_type:complete